MKRRRSRQYETEEAVELGRVLEPYAQQPQWADENQEIPEDFESAPQEEYPEAYLDGYEDFYGEEYSEEHEAADLETRFHVAIGLFDLISIIVGIAVILVLVALLVALFNWLKTDILNSALLLQSGLQ